MVKEEGRHHLHPHASGIWNTARPCDACRAASAAIYCRPDAAFLCSACDAKVHSANKLASRHERVWLCAVCEQAPAAVTCKADAASLCSACDADIHSANPLARRHERLPVVPFVDDHAPPPPLPMYVPSAQPTPDDDEDDDLAATWGGAGHPVADFLSDVDPYLDLDYASSSLDNARIVPAGSDAAFTSYSTSVSLNGASVRTPLPFSASFLSLTTDLLVWHWF
eukprot:TRINITY_DN235_c0_g1_i1.p1 TRINITY_DN235_c0_g1~~TRINITY_DN235_c0_g1_i1.p1  ORF type:complete len:224 (-),score=-39.05 TRINITY_DN235_c0_g1_i1:560-1231(-)